MTDLTAARTAIELGDLDDARRLLRHALQSDPHNAKAWLWLSGITESAETSLEYALRAEAIAPNDAAVIEAVHWAEQRTFRDSAAKPVPQTAKLREKISATDELPVRPTTPKVVMTSETLPEPESDGLGDWIRWLLFVFLVIGLLVLLAFYILTSGGQLFGQQMPPPLPVAVAPPAEIKAAQPPIVVEREVRPVISAELPPRAELLEEPPAATSNRSTTTRSGLLSKQAIALTEPLPAWTPPEPAPVTIGLNNQFTLNEEQYNQLTLLADSSDVQFNEARWIDINLSTQTLIAYENGEPVLTTLISSGAYGMATITGQFRIYARTPSQTMSGYHLGYDYNTPNVPHVQYFSGNFGIHGAYWHEDFGTPVSHGCVNLDEPDAAWLYNWSDVGTLVNVHY